MKMEIEINWLAVGLATVAAMVIGSVWYSRPVFGKIWQRLAGLSDKQVEQGGWAPIILAVPVSFLTAYVLAYLTYISYQFFDVSFLNAALQIAFLAWLGFSATTLAMHNAFEGKRKKLTLLNSFYQLVMFMAAGLIIGLLGV